MSDVVVVGAGVIGLAIAWRCVERGVGVTVVDAAPGSGASHTAAGMLAPLTELHFGESELFALNVAGARRYPSFVAELTARTGMDVRYIRAGTVVAAWDATDLASLTDLQAYGSGLGWPAELLTGHELRRRVPALAPGLPGGLLAPDDHQVDNRLLHAALLRAVEDRATVVRDSVREVLVVDGRARGVRTHSGSRLDADQVVLAAGAHSRTIGGLPPATQPPVRPIKGQTLRLRLPGAPVLDHTVRGLVGGSPIYVVPRLDGELVVGASSEETGFDLRARAGAVYELLRDAQSLLPIVSEAEFVEVSTALRPGSPDNAPIVGPSDIAGLIIATGHYRNGVLLAPITADYVVELIADDVRSTEFADFGPSRFSPAELR